MTKSALRGAHRHREQLSRETINTKFEKRFTICETISEQRSNIYLDDKNMVPSGSNQMATFGSVIV